MALITGKIATQNFELIRNKIGAILALELPAQALLATAEPDLNATVWIERITPFDFTDMPCVNILFSRGDNNSQFTNSNSFTHTYFIDVYTSAKSTSSAEGATTATLKLHRLMGVILAILEAPVYRTLGFSLPSLENTTISNITIADPKNNQDASSVMMGRLTFDVKVRESVELKTAIAIGGADTEVTLNETEKGYFYTYNKPE